MSKKVISVVAIIALVAALALCLTACNQDSVEKRLEKEGYFILSMSAEQLGIEESEIEWIVAGANAESLFTGGDFVVAVKFAKTDDAKEFADTIKSEGDEYGTVKRLGKLVYAGTEAGVKAAM